MLPVATRSVRLTRRRLERPRSRIAARLRCERGTTLIELLIYAVTSLVIFTAVITFLLTTFSQQNETASRVVTNNQAEQGLERLVADLRQAMTSVSISNPTTTTTEIQFYIPTPGSPTSTEAVAWTCPSTGATSVGTCTRVLTGTTTVTDSEINDVQSMSFSALSSSGGALTVPVSNSNSVASVGMTLDVQTSSYAYANASNSNTPLAGTASKPIVIQATADLRNFA